jgi:predicted N-acetyltransferase YhbS
MTYHTEPQRDTDGPEIEALLDRTFGLTRRTKTSYRLREGSAPVEALSRVVRDATLGVVGAISFWPLRIGAINALLLGPLAVHPDRQNLGIGMMLMREGLEQAQLGGHKLVLLVGDEPYYARVGFKRVTNDALLLPGPVNRQRFLYLDLVPGAIEGASGMVLPPHRQGTSLPVTPSVRGGWEERSFDRWSTTAPRGTTCLE